MAYQYFKSRNKVKVANPTVKKKFNVNPRGEAPLIISSPKPCRVDWTTSKPTRPAPPMPNTKPPIQSDSFNNKFVTVNSNRNFVSNQILYSHLK